MKKKPYENFDKLWKKFLDLSYPKSKSHLEMINDISAHFYQKKTRNHRYLMLPEDKLYADFHESQMFNLPLSVTIVTELADHTMMIIDNISISDFLYKYLNPKGYYIIQKAILGII